MTQTSSWFRIPTAVFSTWWATEFRNRWTVDVGALRSGLNGCASGCTGGLVDDGLLVSERRVETSTGVQAGATVLTGCLLYRKCDFMSKTKSPKFFYCRPAMKPRLVFSLEEPLRPALLALAVLSDRPSSFRSCGAIKLLRGCHRGVCAKQNTMAVKENVLLHPAVEVGFDCICALISLALVLGDTVQVLVFDLGCAPCGTWQQKRQHTPYLGTFTKVIKRKHALFGRLC